MPTGNKTDSGQRSSVELSPRSSRKLEKLARARGGLSMVCNKMEILKRALALYQIAFEAAKKGQKLAFVDGDGKVVEKLDVL